MFIYLKFEYYQDMMNEQFILKKIKFCLHVKLVMESNMDYNLYLVVFSNLRFCICSPNG